MIRLPDHAPFSGDAPEGEKGYGPAKPRRHRRRIRLRKFVGELDRIGRTAARNPRQPASAPPEKWVIAMKAFVLVALVMTAGRCQVGDENQSRGSSSASC
jgi:hypothetical protein